MLAFDFQKMLWFSCIDMNVLQVVNYGIMFVSLRRTRDDLSKQSAETSELTNKLDRVRLMSSD